MARIIKFTDNKFFNIDERMLYINGEPVGTQLKGIPFRILEYLAINSKFPDSRSNKRKMLE